MKKPLKIFLITITILFALIGVLFTGVFFAMQFGLLNVKGSIAERNQFFTRTTPISEQARNTPQMTDETQSGSECKTKNQQSCQWNMTREWEVVKGGLEKDAAIIQRVAKETGVSPRLISAIVVPEQIRFFTAEREVFKRYFEPLKILGSLSKFSLGVSGIKQETATLIETYANDPTSPFYPGKEYAPLIAYNKDEQKAEALFNRLTDAKNHYYAYLYTAIFIKEIEMQWKRAGYDTKTSPGTIITLFNLGFAKSHPNEHPEIGGAAITTGGHTYTYGELGAQYFASEELVEVFPK